MVLPRVGFCVVEVRGWCLLCSDLALSWSHFLLFHFDLIIARTRDHAYALCSLIVHLVSAEALNRRQKPVAALNLFSGYRVVIEPAWARHFLDWHLREVILRLFNIFCHLWVFVGFLDYS